VGTFNLDPRSAQLNTEVGLLVDNPVLAEQVAQYIEQGMQPERSWHVQLGDSTKPSSRRMCWSAGDPAHPVIVHHEPEAGFMSRIIMRVLTWLPIDRYL
jgi:putative cardiolipin synthase